MRLRKALHDNKYKILIVVVAVIAVIVIIQMLNNVARDKSAQKQANMLNAVTIPQYEKEQSYSPITSGIVNENATKKNLNVIDEFIEYCNNNEIQKAYDLLTDECKEELYPTINEFTNYYYNLVFTNQIKTHNVQLYKAEEWTYTYKVRIVDDPLKTGKYDESVAVEDYYTIVGDKLNINSFINCIKVNKKIENDLLNIDMSVVSKYIYLDYEIYEIEVNNRTNKNVLLNSGEKINTVYAQNINEVTYTAFISELTSSELTIISNTTKTIKLKINKQYHTQVDIKDIIFTDIIIDLEEYQNLRNKEEYTERRLMELKSIQ